MKALELDQKMQVAQRNLEIAYFNTGYYDTRIPELKERVRLRPEDREARWELGRTFALLGQQRRRGRGISRAAAVHVRATSAALLQLALAEKQAGDIERAQRMPRARAARSIPTARCSTSRSARCCTIAGLNDEALRALERVDRAQSGEPRRALPHGLRARRHGPARGCAGDRHAARSSSIRRCRARTPTSRSTSSARRGPDCADGSQARAAGHRREPARALQPRARLPQQGLLRRGAARVHRRARARRGARPRAAGDGRGAAADAAADATRSTLYDELLERQPTSPKLWNERGVALHQHGRVRRGGGELSPRARLRAVVRDRAQQPRRVALSSRRRRRGDRGVSRRARRSSRRSSRRASTSRCCSAAESDFRSRSTRFARC